MPISLQRFNESYRAKLGQLPERVLEVLRKSGQACTPEEIAAELLGITGRYRRILLPEVTEAAIGVGEALELLVKQGTLRSLSETDSAGLKQTYYALV